MHWSGNAVIGWQSGSYYRSHPYSGWPNAKNISCLNPDSTYNTVVYPLTETSMSINIFLHDIIIYVFMKGCGSRQKEVVSLTGVWLTLHAILVLKICGTEITYLIAYMNSSISGVVCVIVTSNITVT